MKRMNRLKTYSAAVFSGSPLVASSALAQSQSGSGMGPGMMNATGWMGGGYGGIWLLVLLVAVVAGLVGWIIGKKKK